MKLSIQQRELQLHCPFAYICLNLPDLKSNHQETLEGVHIQQVSIGEPLKFPQGTTVRDEIAVMANDLEESMMFLFQ